MPDAIDAAIDVAEHHLGRAAYRTLDNPFLRRVAVESLPSHAREVLRDVLSATRTLGQPPTGVVNGDVGGVRLGVVPRDLQSVYSAVGVRAGVASVNAFAVATKFWWLVSHLWCIEVGRLLDQCLGEHVGGNRLHPAYVERPQTAGALLRTPVKPRSFFAQYLREIARSEQDTQFVSASADLRSYYYSVGATPSEIVSAFLATLDAPPRISRRGHNLTLMLDVAHAMHASAHDALEPRGSGPEIGTRPLPVGLPSSAVISNLIMAVALADLRDLPAVDGAATYVDDILIVSSDLPEHGEDHDGYLRRLGVIVPNADDPDVERIASPAAAALATMVVAADKGRISYGRVVGISDAPVVAPGSDDIFIATPLDPYFDLPDEDDDEDADGPGMQMLFRAPARRDRVPREAVRELMRLTDEIRIGTDREEAWSDLRKLIRNTDAVSRLELRSYWTELAACVHHARGNEGLRYMLAAFDELFDDVDAPLGANRALRNAVNDGLRTSLAQAVAEAIAATSGAPEALAELEATSAERALGCTVEEVEELAQAIRRERFVRAILVSAPLAEFTGWSGPLFGADAYTAFEAWASETPDGADAFAIARGVEKAKRFVRLHEACLAVHLWNATETTTWRARVFKIFGSQPLVSRASVNELKAHVAKILRRGDGDFKLEDVDDMRPVRFAVPSIGVAGDQLEALVDGDLKRLNAISRAARRGIIGTTREAVAHGADAIVFPEWSLPARQLPWLFERSASDQLLAIGGEAPRIVAGEYSNRVWTAIPIRDSLNRPACFVPPPREKRHLSDVEVRTKGPTPQARSSTRVPVYNWNGIGFASLICFEFADIRFREKLRATADLLTVSSWNPDWRYFDAVQEATTRDNYCVTVCVNTSQYPGTRITRPTKNEKAIALSIHGATESAVIVRDVDFRPLVAARRLRRRPSEIKALAEPRDGLSRSDYKPLPPGLR